MAKFKRKERGIKLEFGKKVFTVDVADPLLSKKMISFGEKASNKEEMDNLSIDEQRQEIIDFYNSVLGENAYEEIKTEVFEGEEPMFEDLIDIGYFIIEEINKYNESFKKEEESRMKFRTVAKK